MLGWTGTNLVYSGEKRKGGYRLSVAGLPAEVPKGSLWVFSAGGYSVSLVTRHSSLVTRHSSLVTFIPMQPFYSFVVFSINGLKKLVQGLLPVNDHKNISVLL